MEAVDLHIDGTSFASLRTFVIIVDGYCCVFSCR